MTQEHPITPPPELVEQWYETADNSSKDVIQIVLNPKVSNIPRII